MIPYFEIIFNSKNNFQNLKSNRQKINIESFVEIQNENQTKIFNMHTLSNKIVFNFSDLYNIFIIQPEVIGLLKLKMTQNTQNYLKTWNVTFIKRGEVIKTEKQNLEIDYLASYLNKEKLIFEAGIYFNDILSEDNSFILTLVNKNGKTIQSFVDLSIQVIIEPFCMQKKNDKDYEVINGEKSGIKKIVLRCNKVSSQINIARIMIDGNLLGKIIEFRVKPGLISSENSKIISDFEFSKEGIYIKISFKMRFFDEFLNIIKDRTSASVLNAVNLVLEESRRNSRLKVSLSDTGEDYLVE